MEQFAKYGIPLAGPVSSDRIEGALNAGWQATTTSADPTHPPVRAGVLSLIVCVVRPTSADDAIDAVGHLSRQHPSRALILVPDATFGQRDLEVWTSTSCVPKEGFDQPVCGEQIVIAARGEAPRRLPSLADQLVWQDLPTFLWWTGDLPSNDALFRRLARLADRVIVDSSTFRSLGVSTFRLNSLVRRQASTALTDLSWSRLTPWRELVSQFFDAPDYRAYLAQLDQLAIEYDPSDSTGPSQAALLVGWLAGRLGWHLDGETLSLGSLFHVRLSRGVRRYVDISVEPSAERGLGGLRRVRLGAGDSTSFLVVRDDAASHALTEADVAGSPPVRRNASFESLDVSTLLGGELTLFGHDRVYEQALAVIDGLASGNKA